MASKSTVIIRPEVEQVLRACTFEGFNIYLPAGLSRELYEQVDKVLRLAGAVWDRKQPMGASGIKGAHVITDPSNASKLGFALENGCIVDTKKLHQQYFTPSWVCEQYVEQLFADQLGYEAPPPDTQLRIMEPSAGDGAWLDAILQWLTGGGTLENLPHNMQLVAVEIDQDYVAKLRQKGYAVRHDDFLNLRPKPTAYCDYIFMNPPFTAGQDMRHVLHAFRFLKPGGKLLAITSVTAGTSSFQLHQQFSEFCQAYGQLLDTLPQGTFGHAGTQVATNVWLFTHPDF